MPKHLRPVVIITAAFFLLFHTPASGRRVSAGDAYAPREPSESRTIITENQATALAQYWVTSKADQIFDWQGAIVGRPTQYFDLDGWPTAFVFSVYRGPRSVGYVIVDYEVSDLPILEFSTSPAPHLLCGPECRAAVTGRGLALVTDRPIYLGPLAYFFEAIDPTHQHRNNQRTLVHMDGAFIREIDNQPRRPLPEQTTAVAALPGDLVIEPELIQKIYGVPDYGQFFGPSLGYDFACFSGCTPTAATNLAHFWANAGYPSLGDAYWPDTALDLRSRMETFCYGTTGTTLTSKIAPGLLAFAEARGHAFQSLQYCWPTDLDWVGCNHREFTWQRYADEIDACRPALISISNHPLYGNHTVTGIGYDTSGGRFYIVHDNWTSTPREVWIQHEESIDRHRFLFPLVPPAMDQTPPSSAKVTPLPPYQANTKFDATWNGADAFPGVGSFDVQYRDGAKGEWQWWLQGTTATAGRLSDDVVLLGGHVYFVRARARDKHCNVSDWSTPTESAADAAPPITAVFSQPRYRTDAAFPVAWGGTDDAAGIERFDIWVKTGEDDWRLWQTNGTAASEIFTDTVVGTTYRFTSIGTDRLGREETKDPETPDTLVTRARHSVGGMITGNSGQPAFQATVNSAGAYVSATTGVLGHYALFFPDSQAVTLTVTAPAAFGMLPPMKSLHISETMTDLVDVNLVLPPADNLLQDSHFEEPDPATHWKLGGVVTPAHTLLAHTGDSGLVLGTLPSTLGAPLNPNEAAPTEQAVTWQWMVAQTVHLSPTLSQPALSWFSAISGTTSVSDTFMVSIQGPSDSMTAPVSLSETGWTHHWMGMDETLIGDTVTVTFSLRREPSADQLSVFLDEVTLGSGHRGPTTLFLPLVNQ